MTKLRISPTLARSASVVAFAACFVSATAFAQDATAEEADNEIVVTGIRASLERAIDIKRNASGVVDAISAEDIGKFPDTNLAESLQRIPGVSIDRVNGEGSQVTVRGFGAAFNLVTLNGRQMPTSTSSTGRRRPERRLRAARPAARSTSPISPRKASAGSRSTRPAAPRSPRAASAPRSTSSPRARSTRRATGLSGSSRRQGALRHRASTSFEDTTPEVSGLLSWSDPERDVRRRRCSAAYQRRNSAAASATSNDWNIRPTATSSIRPTASSTAADPDHQRADQSRHAGRGPQRQPLSLSRESRARADQRPGGLQFRPIETLTHHRRRALRPATSINEERTDQTNWFNRPFDQVTFDGNPRSPPPSSSRRTQPGAKDIGFEQQYRATEDRAPVLRPQRRLGDRDGFTLTPRRPIMSRARSRARCAQRQPARPGRLRRAGRRRAFGGLSAAVIPIQDCHDQRQPSAATITACSIIGDLGSQVAAHQRLEPAASHQPGARRSRLGVRRQAAASTSARTTSTRR